MNKTIKVIFMILAVVSIVFCISACSTSMSYTYDVTTGDTIKIELDTSKGYSMTPELPIEITKDGEKIATMTFMESGGYEEFYYAVTVAKENVVIHEDTSKNGLTYIFYQYTEEDGSIENNYIIKVDNSKTGIIFGSMASKEEAEDIFNRLKISLK